MRGHPDLRHPAGTGLEIHDRPVEFEELTPVIDGTSRFEADPDHLQGLGQTRHRTGEGKAIRFDVLGFPGADADYRWLGGHVREGERRLGDGDRVAPDRLGDSNRDLGSTGTAGHVPEQHLPVEVRVGAALARGQPGEPPVPDLLWEPARVVVDGPE